MAGLDGQYYYNGFLSRGYSPARAAALAGHVMQESGGDPTSLNEKEGANGILQWRDSRFQGLQDFAKSQGKNWQDPEVQMDYVGQEMSGPEKRSSQAFNNSNDVASASAALRPYIRFGDNSDATRLRYAQGIYNQAGNGSNSQPVQSPAPANAAPGPSASPPLGPVAAAPASSNPQVSGGFNLNPQQFSAALQQLSNGLNGPKLQPAQIQFLQQPENQERIAQYLQQLQTTGGNNA